MQCQVLENHATMFKDCLLNHFVLEADSAAEPGSVYSGSPESDSSDTGSNESNQSAGSSVISENNGFIMKTEESDHLDDVQITFVEHKQIKELKVRRNRSVFSEYQLMCLESQFMKSSKLLKNKRAELAMKLQLSETQIKDWFKNRRQRSSKMENFPSDESVMPKGHRGPKSKIQVEPPEFTPCWGNSLDYLEKISGVQYEQNLPFSYPDMYQLVERPFYPEDYPATYQELISPLSDETDTSSEISSKENNNFKFDLPEPQYSVKNDSETESDDTLQPSPKKKKKKKKKKVPPKALSDQTKSKNRNPFTAEQSKYLEDIYSRSTFLSIHERQQLAEQMQLTEGQIKNWFQNRRQRAARQEAKLAKEANAAAENRPRGRPKVSVPRKNTKKTSSVLVVQRQQHSQLSTYQELGDYQQPASEEVSDPYQIYNKLPYDNLEMFDLNEGEKYFWTDLWYTLAMMPDDTDTANSFFPSPTRPQLPSFHTLVQHVQEQQNQHQSMVHDQSQDFSPVFDIKEENYF